MACFFSKFSCPVAKVASTLNRRFGPTGAYNAALFGGSMAMGGLGVAHQLNKDRGGSLATRAGRYAGMGLGFGVAGAAIGAPAGVGIERLMARRFGM